jgi:hypothetical protein
MRPPGCCRERRLSAVIHKENGALLALADQQSPWTSTNKSAEACPALRQSKIYR